MKSSLLAALFLIAIAPFARADLPTTYLDDDAEVGDYDVSATVTALPAEFVLAGQANGDGYLLKLAAGKIEFDTQRDGKQQALASASYKVAPGAFVVQRRGPAWRLVGDNRVLLEAEDDQWHAGKLGLRGGAKDGRMQPVEDIAFDDDFMRIASDVVLAGTKADPRNGSVRIADVKSTETLWTGVLGSSSTTGLNENGEARVAQSVNPFAFKSNNAGPNLAVAGRQFWDDYTAEASVKPEGATEVGLALYCQDAKNYLLLRWKVGGPMQLQAIVDGEARVLDEAPGGYEEKQWYRLKLSMSRGLLRAYLDDAEIMRATTGLFGRGQVGLYSNNPDPQNTATFDDVRVRSEHDFLDDFTSAVPGRWQSIAGGFRMNGVAVPATTDGAYEVMGEAGWGNYTAAEQIALPPSASAGLILHHVPGKGAYLLRITGSKADAPYAGTAQILKIAAGKTQVLGETPIGSSYDHSTETWTFTVDNGYLQGKCGDKRLVDAYDDTLAEGRAGIYGQSGPKDEAPRLSSFEVSFPEQHATWAKIPDLYTDDRQAETMGGWSTPEGLWVAQPIVLGGAAPAPAAPAPADTKVYWHKGVFWGDRGMRFKMPALVGDQKVVLTFSASPLPDPAKTAATLTLCVNAGQLVANLAGAPVGTAHAPSWIGQCKLAGPVETQTVEVDRRGTFVIVRVGEAEKAVTLVAARVG